MIIDIMEQLEEESEIEISITRASSIGHQTDTHNETERVVQGIAEYDSLDVPSFFRAYQLHPAIKDQPRLMQK